MAQRHRLRSSVSRTVLSSALLCALAAPALADVAAPRTLDQVVVTASGFEQKITDAPASISVITREELAKRPYMTLLDAVRDLEGVDVGETRDKTGQGSVSMRGMGSDYTLLLINGRRQNNHGDIYPNNFGGNQFNHIPPLDAIERIEVIRGPASTLYGADAMGGVINVITKRNLDSWHGSATVGRTFETDDQFGDDTTVDAFLTGPLVPGVLNLSARASWYDRKASNPVYSPSTDPAGVQHTRPLGFGAGGKTVDNTNKAGGVSLEWNVSDAQRVTLDFDTSRQEYDNSVKINDAGVEEYPVGTVDGIASIWRGNTTTCITRRNCVRADPRVGYSASQEFTRDAWALTHEGDWSFGRSLVSLAHVATNNDGRTMPFTVDERRQLLQMLNATGAYAGQTEAQRRSTAEATFLPRPKRTLESAQYTLDAKLDIPFQAAGEHIAVVGAQVIRGELTDGVFGMETGNPGQTQDHNMYSVFAEDTWNITAPFALTYGLRFDDHEVFGNHLSPRVYGVYTFNDAWTMKGGVSTGFKTPKTTQLYDGVTGFGGQGTTPLYGNPDLQPETSTSTELAVYWQHPAGHSANATVFHNKFDDKIANQPCGPALTLACSSTGEFGELGYANSNRTVNIDEVVIQGVEVAGRWAISDRFALRANYTYTDSEQKSGAEKGLPLGLSAKHMANATFDWQASERFNVFLTGEMRSKRYRGVSTLSGQPQYYKDYTVLHLGASFEATQWLTVNARINNLLDRDFTTYQATFNDLDGDGAFADGTNEVLFEDDYNNKDKARSVWVSLNFSF
ncbi:TonB-dependent receptor [Stenotrophomonas sp. CFBP 13725]|uniref:TonB-dependent receptor domain-containing protein n=1 Tax=Stenotrophomonas sp. CFBP 13725 TaxID=2775297 RepID=UPI00177E79A8|nr:TonB-dependent receptor [Stenotrophomonas sp. CFBP 13725]MBD8636406.1 TonB-dependent receptor [Stenotrophomonas sp. CFBP 13725]